MLEQLYYWTTEYIWVFGVALFVWMSLKGISYRDQHHRKAQKKWKDTVRKELHEPTTLHPQIDPNLCGGCGACVSVCPEGEIIKLINHKAVLVEPSKCVGHGQCEIACPFNAIRLAFGTKTRGMDLPRIDSNYQTNVPGLYIAGELGGMGLIRNASKQGKLSAEHAIKTSKPGFQGEVDILIVGAGPAGLAASLACHQAKARYICIEQNRFGGTIYNFPRQKVVMSQPLQLPLVGEIKFQKNKVSKEEILGLWNHIRKRAGLKIMEETKFINLKKHPGGFIVETSRGVLRAQKVILALGVRGSPRKLGVPNEHLPKVTYNLLEPEQYQNKWIAVVGGGNAAVEAAQYLARPQYKNRVFLLVRGQTFTKCNEDNQNLILSMQKQGLVHISYNTTVDEIHQNYIFIKKDKERLRLQNDFVFIFAGAELPFKFLKDLGVMIETKYGEPLKSG